mgnify:CR=1 FL=1
MNTETTNKDILTHHLTAFGENNLDEILKDYTEQSVILTNEGQIKGLTKIKDFFDELFKLIPTGSVFEMLQFTIVDHVAHIIWKSSSTTATINFGTDTFFLAEGKILFHTVAADIKIID